MARWHATWIQKWLVALAVVGVAAAAYLAFSDRLSIDSLVAQEATLRRIKNERPVWTYGVAFLIYVAVTGFSLPGATALSLISGWLFGFWRGLLFVSFASTTGATLAFLISRYLLRDFVQKRFSDKLAVFLNALEKDGVFYLFLLRLIPAVPFFVINVVMGVTFMPVRTFWWVSQLGMLPGTALYVYAGSSLPSLADLQQRGLKSILSPQWILALAILGIVPLLTKKLLQHWGYSPVDGRFERGAVAAPNLSLKEPATRAGQSRNNSSQIGNDDRQASNSSRERS
jgi:uncharacterized membrane protein YdjX (TVP38/TMEM64 family)